MKRIKAVRGAVQLKADTQEEIQEWVCALLKELVEKNRILEKNIVSIQFTQTRDISSANPATALRTSGFKNTPLVCSQEPDYTGSLERIIRVMVTFYGKSGEIIRPVYLNGAEKLRRDILVN